MLLSVEEVVPLYIKVTFEDTMPKQENKRNIFENSQQYPKKCRYIRMKTIRKKSQKPYQNAYWLKLKYFNSWLIR